MPAGRPSSAEHPSATHYRNGCRCVGCRTAHADAKAQRTLETRYGADGPMGPEVRRDVVKRLRSGLTVAQAAAELNVSHQLIYAACKAIPEFSEQVDELTRARD